MSNEFIKYDFEILNLLHLNFHHERSVKISGWFFKWLAMAKTELSYK